MPCLKLTVNGQPHSVDIDGPVMLAGVLRENLRLTGTKIGCEEAECGACTVIVDGQPVDELVAAGFSEVSLTSRATVRWVRSRVEPPAP